MNTGRILIGVLGGIAVGAALGILFAPDKGSSTRRMIAQKSDDYVHDLEARFTDLVNSLTHKIEALVGETTDAVENGKKQLAESHPY